jgi:hypothetical protein
LRALWRWLTVRLAAALHGVCAPIRRMPIIYRKTAKGLAEVETRVYRLAPRLRSVLIVIDGKRSDEELTQLLPQAHEALAVLLEEDFIAEFARTAAAPPPPPAYEQTVILPKGPGAAFEAMRRDLLRAFNDRAGPAGETLAIKMERATSEAEFRALLPQAIRLVSTIKGSDAGNAFAARVDAW